MDNLGILFWNMGRDI